MLSSSYKRSFESEKSEIKIFRIDPLGINYDLLFGMALLQHVDGDHLPE